MRTLILLLALTPVVTLQRPAFAQIPLLTEVSGASLDTFPTDAIPASGTPNPLPDAPSPTSSRRALVRGSAGVAASAPCHSAAMQVDGSPGVDTGDGTREPCLDAPNPYRRFLDSTTPIPLTPLQKAHLAFHNLKDPGNLVTILGTSGFTIGTNAHTAYGPGWRGFGINVGDSLLQDATGEFFGTFLISSLAHEDPHYHRLPHATVKRRIFHAITRTVIAQSDDGQPMPNYSTLLTYPISAEISNLYVPGIHGNGPSTVARIMTGYATDPANNLITEFLPDVAKHIHIQVIFVQGILNQIAADQYALP